MIVVPSVCDVQYAGRCGSDRLGWLRVRPGRGPDQCSVYVHVASSCNMLDVVVPVGWGGWVCALVAVPTNVQYTFMSPLRVLYDCYCAFSPARCAIYITQRPCSSGTQQSGHKTLYNGIRGVVKNNAGNAGVLLFVQLCASMGAPREPQETLRGTKKPKEMVG